MVEQWPDAKVSSVAETSQRCRSVLALKMPLADALNLVVSL